MLNKLGNTKFSLKVHRNTDDVTFLATHGFIYAVKGTSSTLTQIPATLTIVLGLCLTRVIVLSMVHAVKSIISKLILYKKIKHSLFFKLFLFSLFLFCLSV